MTDEEINDQELDRFEARFFGTMSEQEVAAFDADLERDPELKERYALFAFSVRGIRSGGVASSAATASLREQLEAIDRELDARQDRGRSVLSPWMGWAAAAVLLIGGTSLWWLNQRNGPAALAEEFALSEPGLPVLMNTAPQDMDGIMNAYKQDKLSEALDLLISASERDPGNDTLRYFSGVVMSRMEGCGPALQWFTSVPTTSVFAAKAEYNLALCALRANDIEHARSLLTRTAGSTDHQVAARSRELLDRLANK